MSRDTFLLWVGGLFVLWVLTWYVGRFLAIRRKEKDHERTARTLSRHPDLVLLDRHLDTWPFPFRLLPGPAVTTWYIALCEDCTPILPMPFLVEAERDVWVAKHREGTGFHEVSVYEETR